MTKGSFIPMSPEELPKQRLYEVVDLPPTPGGLETKLDWVEPFPDDRPKTTPRKVQFLCAVEWAWSPMHNRIDNYYLHQRGKRWLIWNNWLDDKLIIVGLDKSSETKLRRNLEADLTKSFIKDATKRKKKTLPKEDA